MPSNLDITIKQAQGTHSGTAVKTGKTTTVEIPELIPALQAKVDEYNAALAAAYKILEGTVLHSVMPVAKVKLIHISEVQANDYNPNSVAGQEMKLLHTSISSDGYTQPVVSVLDHSCDILLPCGHLSPLPQSLAEGLMLSSWGIQQGFSMARVRSARLSRPQEGGVAGEYRSASRQATTARISATGFETSGTSDVSTDLSTRSGEQQSSTSTPGTSIEAATSSTSSEFFCPTCESSEHVQGKYWLASELMTTDTSEDLGLRVNWLSSESMLQSPLNSLLDNFDDLRTRFERSGESSDSSDLDLVLVDCRSKAIIVDGFHRYTTMRRYQDIADSSSGYLPVVVLEKSIADRIASTVRHNRARGKHSVAGMGNLVFQMLEAGEDDATICNKLGLEAEELARLKHITGFSKLFKDVEYSPVIMTKAQLEAKAAYARENPGVDMPGGV